MVSPYYIGHKQWCFKLEVMKGDDARMQGDKLSMTVE